MSRNDERIIVPTVDNKFASGKRTGPMPAGPDEVKYGTAYLHLAVHDLVKMLDNYVDLNDAFARLKTKYPRMTRRALQNKFKGMVGWSAKSYLANRRTAYVRDMIRQWGDGQETRKKIAGRLGLSASGVSTIFNRAGLSKTCAHRISYQLPTIKDEDDTIYDQNGRLRSRTDILRDLYRG